LLLLAALTAGCTTASSGEDALRVAATPVATTAPVKMATPAPTAVAAAATAKAKAKAPVPTVRTQTPRPRVVTEQAWTPFAAVGGVTLRHPSKRVERVAFHQSNHEGARQLTPLPTAVAPSTLESRDRLTGTRTAADVVIDPAVEVRAPVTGRVKRAGTYVLYCEHSDDYAVIEPDGHPGWEVKILHIDGVAVRPGDRVTAGATVVAPRPTKLPFESQVDETSAPPAWPHVHIEVVDPSIPNKPSPGSGC
jgi:hypothetical protein